MQDKSSVFRALHEREGLFVMPNPWDIGTACLLAQLGYKALATASAALAFMEGVEDGTGRVSREAALAHAGRIVGAASLPVNGDLENGFGASPESVADTIKGALDVGLAGCSIEDATGDPHAPLYDMSLAQERIEAARSVLDAVRSDFVLTARAECFLTGHEDPLRESIRRLQAYAEAGADVLYAPGLSTASQIAELVRALPLPVNVLGGTGGEPLPLNALQDLGVKRVSLGPRLLQAALSGFLQAAEEIKAAGVFSFMGKAKSMDQIYKQMILS